MQRFKVIAARIIILVTVIPCYEQDTFAQNDLFPVSTECSDGNNRQQSCFISHMDPSADDPIPQFGAADLFAQEIEQLTVSREIYLFPSPRLPIWQPPRITTVS